MVHILIISKQTNKQTIGIIRAFLLQMINNMSLLRNESSNTISSTKKYIKREKKGGRKKECMTKDTT